MLNPCTSHGISANDFGVKNLDAFGLELVASCGSCFCGQSVTTADSSGMRTSFLHGRDRPSYNRLAMLLYYITDRNGFAGTESERRTALLRRIAEAARAGVDYIQLREKDLAHGPLELLAREALERFARIPRPQSCSSTATPTSRSRSGLTGFIFPPDLRPPLKFAPIGCATPIASRLSASLPTPSTMCARQSTAARASQCWRQFSRRSQPERRGSASEVFREACAGLAFRFSRWAA